MYNITSVCELHVRVLHTEVEAVDSGQLILGVAKHVHSSQGGTKYLSGNKAASTGASCAGKIGYRCFNNEDT